MITDYHMLLATYQPTLLQEGKLDMFYLSLIVFSQKNLFNASGKDLNSQRYCSRMLLKSIPEVERRKLLALFTLESSIGCCS